MKHTSRLYCVFRTDTEEARSLRDDLVDQVTQDSEVQVVGTDVWTTHPEEQTVTVAFVHEPGWGAGLSIPLDKMTYTMVETWPWDWREGHTP